MVLAGIAFSDTEALADTVTYDFNIEFSGATAPSGTPPWLRAIFDDADSSGSVALTMQVLNITDVLAKVTEWDFNLIDESIPLTFAHVSGAVATVSTGINAFKADGDGWFDIKFAFPNTPASATLGNQGFSSSAYTITGAGINAHSFVALSAPGGGSSPGPFFSAAHVQGLGAGGGYSGWVAPSGSGSVVVTSAPGGLSLFASGLLGLVALRRRRRAA